MCDFHSILGVALGNDFEIRHDADNSHSAMSGRLENKPNRVPVIFEAECSADKLMATADIDSVKSSIIRNYGECPEPLVKKIVAHYQRVKEALTDGRHLSAKGYFGDVSKYRDVWERAMQRGVMPDFSEIEVFPGSVYVRENATFTAPVLKEVAGSVDVSENATFTAPVLKEVAGSVYVRENATFTAPKLNQK